MEPSAPFTWPPSEAWRNAVGSDLDAHDQPQREPLFSDSSTLITDAPATEPPLSHLQIRILLLDSWEYWRHQSHCSRRTRTVSRFHSKGLYKQRRTRVQASADAMTSMTHRTGPARASILTVSCMFEKVFRRGCTCVWGCR
jgi:hypothetical protein